MADFSTGCGTVQTLILLTLMWHPFLREHSVGVRAARQATIPTTHDTHMLVSRILENKYHTARYIPADSITISGPPANTTVTSESHTKQATPRTWVVVEELRDIVYLAVHSDVTILVTRMLRDLLQGKHSSFLSHDCANTNRSSRSRGIVVRGTQAGTPMVT